MCIENIKKLEEKLERARLALSSVRAAARKAEADLVRAEGLARIARSQEFSAEYEWAELEKEVQDKKGCA
jgi:multidrug resistance efflux pump